MDLFPRGGPTRLVMFDKEMSDTNFVCGRWLGGKVFGEVGLEMGYVGFGRRFPTGFVCCPVKVVGHLSCFRDTYFPFWRESGGLRLVRKESKERGIPFSVSEVDVGGGGVCGFAGGVKLNRGVKEVELA